MGDTIEKTWYGVESKELCSIKVESLMFFGKASKLVAMGADTITYGATHIFSFNLNENGRITNIVNSEKIDSYEFRKNVKKEERYNVQEAHSWFFQERYNQSK